MYLPPPTEGMRYPPPQRASDLHPLSLKIIFLLIIHIDCFRRFGPSPVDTLDPWTTHGPAITLLIIFLRDTAL
jgi:hypothetical protein